MNECTIFRKFGEKKEIVLQAMKQSRWHPDLTPDDFSTWSGDMEEDLSRFAHSYMDKVTERFVKLSIGLRTPGTGGCHFRWNPVRSADIQEGPDSLFWGNASKGGPEAGQCGDFCHDVFSIEFWICLF